MLTNLARDLYRETGLPLLLGSSEPLFDEDERSRVPPSELAPGVRVGSYVVETSLACGGQAEVWRVRHVRLGSEHALKVPLRNDDDTRHRLVQEARVQAQLRHPCVVAATDLLELDGGLALVTELVDGGETLEHRVSRGPMPLEEAEPLFLDLLDAVEFAHSRGIVHRDLKPSNILLAHVGTRVLPKVADWGLARSTRSTQDRLTQQGYIMGSPAFMAPEQARDAASADERADVFSLGAILYEMVTGRPAFSGDTVEGILERSASGTWVPPEQAVGGLPERVGAAIRGALEPDRACRFPTVGCLRAALLGKPVVSRAPPSGPAMKAWTPDAVGAGAARTRRTRVMLTSGVVLSAGVAAALWWAA